MSDAENPTTKPIIREGPSVSVPASEISFINTGVKTEKGELRAGPAYGDLQNGRHGTFVRMPAGFKSPVHTHTEDYFAVVVEGVGSNHPVGAEAKPLPKGSYWFQRGEEAHVMECLSETDCLFFIVQPGKFDYVIDETANKKYDRPLDYVFCTVTREGEEDCPIYTNLADRRAGTRQQNIDYFRPVLAWLGIEVPEQMFLEVELDQFLRSGNRDVDHTGRA